jgi:hypothetical protein
MASSAVPRQRDRPPRADDGGRHPVKAKNADPDRKMRRGAPRRKPPDEDKSAPPTPPPKPHFAAPGTATWDSLRLAAQSPAKSQPPTAAAPSPIREAGVAPPPAQTALFLPPELCVIVPDDSQFGTFSGPIRRLRRLALSDALAGFERLPAEEEPPPPPEAPQYPLFMLPGYPYPVFIPGYGDQAHPAADEAPGDRAPVAVPYPYGQAYADFYPPVLFPTPAAAADDQVNDHVS